MCFRFVGLVWTVGGNCVNSFGGRFGLFGYRCAVLAYMRPRVCAGLQSVKRVCLLMRPHARVCFQRCTATATNKMLPIGSRSRMALLDKKTATNLQHVHSNALYLTFLLAIK